MIPKILVYVVGSVGLLTTTTARAQEIPQAEIFGGYSYLRGTPTRQTNFGKYTDFFNANGWDVSLVGNANRWLGLEVSLSDHYGTSAEDLAIGVLGVSGVRLDYAPRFTFLFGPAFSYRMKPRITPFAHVLVGGTRGTGIAYVIDLACAPFGGGPPCGVIKSQTAFTIAFGGGLDVKATPRFWIRPIQADYLRANFASDAQNNVRLSTGILMMLGRR